MSRTAPQLRKLARDSERFVNIDGEHYIDDIDDNGMYLTNVEDDTETYVCWSGVEDTDTFKAGE
jgi:hypothetical protein